MASSKNCLDLESLVLSNITARKMNVLLLHEVIAVKARKAFAIESFF